MQQFSKLAKCGAWSTWSTTIANSNWSQKPDNLQNFKEDEDGDVIMIIENDVTMEEIPEDVITEDLSDNIYKPKATKLQYHDGQETRDGKKTGKNKAKKGKNKLNKSC